MENSTSYNISIPSPMEDRQDVAERERKRRRRSRMAQLMGERRFRLNLERESKMTMMLSLARRAVRRALTYDPNTIVGRWRRDRMLRKWQQDSSELVKLSRPWNNP